MVPPRKSMKKSIDHQLDCLTNVEEKVSRCPAEVQGKEGKVGSVAVFSEHNSVDYTNWTGTLRIRILGMEGMEDWSDEHIPLSSRYLHAL
jgi:hypothetical protein